MTWHIADYVERGEIDNRERDYVTGRIWLRGIDEPIRLDLVGNAREDLAGRCLRFHNPAPHPLPAEHRHLAGKQQGTVVEITAARKVREPLVPFIDLEDEEAKKDPTLFHWANGFYVEWHCTRNGRLVIESTDFELTADTAEPAAGTEKGARDTGRADTVSELLDGVADKAASPDPEAENDLPQSVIEAEAEAEIADFDLVRDRIAARLKQEYAIDAEVHDRIIAEERARLRRERGLAELEPGSSEADEADTFWLHEMDATTEELFEADLSPLDEERRHPLVKRCQELSLRLNDDIEHHGWATEHATTEHPLHEVTNSLCYAAAKLAGALCCIDFWPEVSYPGSTLVRLKRARRRLIDARDALRAAREEKLAPDDWIDASERELESIHRSVQVKIDTIRAVLRDYEARWL